MFSELSNLTAETGLEFSDAHTALYGEKRGFGVTVADRDGSYVIDIFCEAPSERRAEISAAVTGAGESLPKNTLMSQSFGRETVTVVLDAYRLMQENAVYLIEFLDKLTGSFSALGIKGKSCRFFAEEKPAEAVTEPPADGEKRVKLGFDLRSVLGVVGAVIGAAAMIVIAVLTVNASAEITAFGLSTEISAYILSGITAVVIFADYRFLARKLDACGILTCPVLTVLAVILSGLGAGVRACAQFAGVSFMKALGDYAGLLGGYPEVDQFVTGYITRGVVLAAVASIGICVFYFNRHPEETIRSERVVSPDEGPLGNTRKKR